MKKKTVLISCLCMLLLAGAVLAGIFVLMPKTESTESGNLANIDWFSEEQEEFVLTTANELYELEELSRFYDFKGKIVKLGADIVINEGNAQEWDKEAPSRRWYPIRNFAGTFDGQGYSISGIYGKSVDNSMGLFINTKTTCVIKNFKLVNSYFYSVGSLAQISCGTASIVSNGAGRLEKVYSDAIIHSNGGNVAGIMSLPNDTTIVSECWFDGEIRSEGRYAGGIVDSVWDATVTIEHCLNSGDIHNTFTFQSATIGGILGVTSTGAKVYMDDCLNIGLIDTQNHARVGAVLGGSGGTGVTVLSNSYASSESYKRAVGNVVANLTGSAMAISTKRLTGIEGYRWTTLDFDSYWATVEEGTPVLGCFADSILEINNIAKAFSTDWYSKDGEEFTINTVEEFYGLTYLSATEPFTGQVIKLGADIVLNQGSASKWEKEAPEDEWIPVSTFSGTFDGQGHTISGLYVDADGDNVGMFKETTVHATIKNLKLENSYVSSKTGSIVGSVAGLGNGTFDTVYSDAIVHCSNYGAGGIVGRVNSKTESRISNCQFAGTVNFHTDGGSRGGGIVGIANLAGTKVYIDNCLFNGVIISERTDGAANIGGICGLVSGGGEAEISQCLSTGQLIAIKGGVGTHVAQIGTDSKVTVKNSYALKGKYKGVAVVHDEKTLEGNVILFDEERLTSYGGYQWTELDFSKYWTVVTDGTPLLKSFTNIRTNITGLEKLFDMSWYSKNAKTYHLSDAKDLFGFTILSSTTDFKDKTIVLDKDIEVLTGTKEKWLKENPAQVWIPIEDFAGIFDGNNHTIKGIYVNSTEERAGLFRQLKEDGVVKNLRLENTYITSSEGIVGSFVGRCWGTLDTVYSNAIIEVSNQAVGGLVGQVNGKKNAEIKKGWFDGEIIVTTDLGTRCGGLVGTVIVEQTTLDLSNCLNTGSLSSKDVSKPELGGLVGRVSAGATVTMKDSLYAGKIQGKNTTYIGTLVGVNSKSTVMSDDVCGVKQEAKLIALGKIQGTASLYQEQTLWGLGVYYMTNWNFKDIWMTVANETPILRAFAGSQQALAIPEGTIKASTEWYKKGEVSTIKNLSDMLGFMKLSSNNNFAGDTIKIGANIDLTGVEWTPTGSFAGIFDGGLKEGYKITNLTIKNNSDFTGMFSIVEENGIVRNLELDGGVVESTAGIVGSVAGRFNGTMDTVKSSAIVKAGKGTVGGLVGQVQLGNASFDKCWFDGEVHDTDGQTGTGGLIGTVINKKTVVTVNNCLNTGKIISGWTQETYASKGIYPHTGGFVGRIATNATLKIKNSLFAGEMNIHTNGNIGAFVGRIHYTTKGGEIFREGIVETENVYAIQTKWDKMLGSGTAIASGDSKIINENQIRDYGGCMLSGLDFENEWTLRTAHVPGLKVFSKEETLTVDTSWYTPNGESNKYQITSEAAWWGFWKLSQTNQEFIDDADKVIELKTDVSINSDLDNLTRMWTPIPTFKGTLNGENHKIVGLYINSNDEFLGLIAKMEDENAVVCNLRLEGGQIVGNGEAQTVGSIVGRSNGKIDTVYSDVDMIISAGNVGGLVGQMTGNSIPNVGNMIRNCWYAGNIQMTSASAWQKLGGLAGNVQTEVIVDNCMVTGSLSASDTSNSKTSVGGFVGRTATTNAKVIVRNSVLIGTLTTDVSKGRVVGRIDGGTAIVHASYGIETITVDTGAGTLAGSMSAVKQGNDSFEMKGIDFTQYYTATKGYPVLTSFKDYVDLTEAPNVPAMQEYTGWYSENGATNNTITSVGALCGFASLAKGGKTFAGQTVTLGADILFNDMTKEEMQSTPANVERQWTPIARFEGVFEGQGYTIYGLYTSRELPSGMFNIVAANSDTKVQPQVKNFNLIDAYFYTSGANPVGSIAATGNGLFKNIKVDAIVKAKNSTLGTGGIVGRVNSASCTNIIENCWFDGEVVIEQNTGYRAGGIVGNVIQALTISNCLNTGNIRNLTTRQGCEIGGIVGRVGAFALTIEYCVSTNIYANKNMTTAGTILGRNQGGSVTITHAYGLADGTYNCVSASDTGLPSGAVAANLEAAQLTGDAARTILSGYGFNFNSSSNTTYWKVTEQYPELVIIPSND